jgi:hypothetical protein
MNKELVEIRQGADPSDAEEPDRRTGPDGRDERRKVLALGQSGPMSLGKPRGGTRQNETRSSDRIMFSQHEVGREIVGGPALEEGGNRRAELVEKITELKALSCVEGNIDHAGTVYGRFSTKR